MPCIQFGPLHRHQVSLPSLELLDQDTADLQIYRMAQMLALGHSSTESIPCLEDGDFGSMLQQDIRTPQASEAGAYDAHAELS